MQVMQGTDTPLTPVDDGLVPGTWTWRGTGFLRLVTSRWEVLGCGSLTGGTEEGEAWMVIYASKTLYTPSVLNVYTRRKGALDAAELGKLKEALRGFGSEEVDGLVEEIYEVLQE